MKGPNDEKKIKFGASDGLSAADAEQDKTYTSIFEVCFYTKETIPRFKLPYGLICGKGDMERLLNDSVSDPDGWSRIVYDDSVEFIRIKNDRKRDFEWYHEFIVFTNLQIVFYMNHKLIRDENLYNPILDFTAKQIRNLRSSVARNALLFVERLVEIACQDAVSLMQIFRELAPQLLTCSISEKAVYREPSTNILMLFCSKCDELSRIDIFWTFFDHVKNKNAKLSNSAVTCVKACFDNFKEGDYVEISLNKLSPYLEYCLDGKSVQAREVAKIIGNAIASKLTDKQISSWIHLTRPRSALHKLLECKTSAEIKVKEPIISSALRSHLGEVRINGPDKKPFKKSDKADQIFGRGLRIDIDVFSSNQNETPSILASEAYSPISDIDQELERISNRENSRKEKRINKKTPMGDVDIPKHPDYESDDVGSPCWRNVKICWANLHWREKHTIQTRHKI